MKLNMIVFMASVLLIAAVLAYTTFVSRVEAGLIRMGRQNHCYNPPSIRLVLWMGLMLIVVRLFNVLLSR